MTKSIIETTGRERVVLLAVTGMSPAVLTETVWALSREDPPVVPDRVIVITTSGGRSAMIETLLSERPGFENRSVWDALRDDIQQHAGDIGERLRFGSTGDDIRVITGRDSASGQSIELEDLRSSEENSAVADFVLETVRSLVENPDIRLFASLAGGRKTMGALLYACMTLIGRDDDRLFHVLVSKPYESPHVEPPFFFPTQTPQKLSLRHDECVEAIDARIDLPEVPFIPLRKLFDRDLGERPGSFKALIQSCQEGVRERSADQIDLKIYLSKKEIIVCGKRIELGPREMIVMVALAKRCLLGNPPIEGFHRAMEESVNPVRREIAGRHTGWQSAESIGSDMDEGALRRVLSDIRSKLRAMHCHALIDFLPRRGHFAIDLPAGNIEIND